jgi:hypothetical protein
MYTRKISKEGIMIMKEGKAWGVKADYGNFDPDRMGWGPVCDGSLYPLDTKDIESLFCKNSPGFKEMEGAELVRVQKVAKVNVHILPQE